MLIGIFKDSSDKSLKRQILRCFNHILQHMISELTNGLLLIHIYELFVGNITQDMYPGILELCLNGLYYLLKYGKETSIKSNCNIIAQAVVESNLINVVEDLYCHNSKLVAELARKIILEFFTEEEQTYQGKFN